jgi:hypothetical protein
MKTSSSPSLAVLALYATATYAVFFGGRRREGAESGHSLKMPE